ncbi:armadillo-type protein [Suillus clintonianus]|uniref:armadillo-type protein n=1 Tax=Suillus clintonianus TaxID=1904413 RepID=UPI001B87234F|nr:armadillo-type protein [Suillus clintonianus]KAG2124196.1 armadillo-type protein [Suillus clintonianus]
MVAQTRAGNSAPKRLAFSEKIVGKGLATDALLKKLKALHTELAGLDQELVDVNSLSSVRTQLVNTSILLHKDRGVKAYAACCLADILRLYAPDAPYTHTELRDIFQFFFRQLATGLRGAEASYYNEYFHLLESLSTVKSVVLVCDLPHAEELMVDIFRDFFGLVRRDLAKKIEIFIADILVALLDECQALPSEVLETIMAQFMANDAQPAYRLAVQICNATADKLQRHVCQYFTDIIVANSHESDSESNFEEIRKAHELVKQLSRSCPSLLHSVIPQLEEELRVEEVQVRLIATQALGEMFSEKGGAELVKKYPTTWNVWLMRKNDKAAAVRLKLVESAKGLLVNLHDHRETVDELMRLKLLDPDEKVRAAVCKVYSQLDYETVLHYVSEDQLRSIAGRGMDKKNSVRVEALNSLGKLYSTAYSEIENNDPAAIRHFSWIPNEILHISNSTQEAKLAAEQVIADFVFPLPSVSSASTSKSVDVDEVAWTDQLLNTMSYLDDRGVNAVLLLSCIKGSRPSPYELYLQSCVQHNGGIIDEDEDVVKQRLNNVIRHISRQFGDPQKAAEDLHAFARANENRLYKLLKTCLDTQTDLKGLVKASNEFLRRIEQGSESILGTMTVFLRRATLRIVNQSSIPTLIKRVQRADSKHAQTLLTYISKHCPALYKPHISELTKAIADEKNPRLVEVGMQALAAVSRSDEALAVNDKRTLERVMRYVLGSNARVAKFAARILVASKEHDDLCAEAVMSIAKKLSTAEPDLLVAHTAVLAQFARLAPDAFERKSDVLMAFLVKKLLMVPSPADPDEMDSDADWVEDDDVPPRLRARILALKVCRNRCLAHASTDTALEVATPVLKMLSTLLDHAGSYSADATDDPKVKSRMRLQAAISLLHLSVVDKFVTAINTNFISLAITVQDPCYNVRMEFLMKIFPLLTARKLPAQYNLIPFLTVHDPEADVKSRAISYVTHASRNLPAALKVDLFEIIFIRLLHLLAHHPDFSTAHENLQEMAKYIEFYLDLIASSDNVSLLYHLAMKAKTVRDGQSHTYSENLYAMSELAQELIKARAQARSWSLQSYPGRVKLPSDILRALPNPEAATKILKTVYLPEETSAWLLESSKSQKPAGASKEKRREPREHKDSKSPPKRKASRHRPNGTTKRAKTARWNSDQSESEEEPSSDDSEQDDREETPAKLSSEREDGSSGQESDEEANEKKAESNRKPSRKAGTRAKRKISKQVKKKGSHTRKS